MSTVSADQRFAILAKLGENIDWNSLTKDQVQLGITNCQRAGREATEFIRNGFCLTVSDSFSIVETLPISIPALPRPTLEELQKNFSWIKSIERDASPTEAITLNLATVLRLSEDRISGEEYEKRIAPKLNLILGYQQAIWLVEHQDELPEFIKLIGKIYVDFSGLVVVSEGGRRGIPYLSRLGRRWDLDWHWLSLDFRRHARVAFSGK